MKTDTAAFTTHPVLLTTDSGDEIDCIQVCREGEAPLEGAEVLDHHDSLDNVMNTYADICKIAKNRNERVPYLLLSAPV